MAVPNKTELSLAQLCEIVCKYTYQCISSKIICKEYHIEQKRALSIVRDFGLPIRNGGPIIRNTETRKCSICKEIKSLEMFYKQKTLPLGRTYSCKDCTKRTRLRRLYNLDERIHDHCLICGITVNLKVDHSHVSGKVRGTLCQNCNIGLGHFKDDITLLGNAIKYLEEYDAKQE